MIVNHRPGFLKDADVVFFRTKKVWAESFAENKCLGKTHVPSVKIVEYLKTLKINFPNSNLDTSGTLEIPVMGVQIKHLLFYRTDMPMKVLEFMHAPHVSR